jgi:hypothetical protein
MEVEMSVFVVKDTSATLTRKLVAMSMSVLNMKNHLVVLMPFVKISPEVMSALVLPASMAIHFIIVKNATVQNAVVNLHINSLVAIAF